MINVDFFFLSKNLGSSISQTYRPSPNDVWKDKCQVLFFADTLKSDGPSQAQ